MNSEYVIKLTPTDDGKSLICEECNAKISAETKNELQNAIINHMLNVHHLKGGQLRFPD